MYRHSAQAKFRPPNVLASPDSPSDSDSDVKDTLGRKRRQLDEEVSEFKAAKDREFRDFERDLRLQRSRSRALSKSCDSSPSKPKASSSNTSSVLNLLGSSQNGTANGCAGHTPKRGREGHSDTPTKPAPLSKPTLSLDKLNINGETLPASHPLGTPPTPSFTLRRPPPIALAHVTPPRAQSGNKQPPTPSSERVENFAGVFLPAYLPLLESRGPTPLARNPQPMNTKEEERKRLQLNGDGQQDAEKQSPQRASSESLPPAPVSPTMLAAKRSRSAPQMPSASLPSALRTSNGNTPGGGGKRKHVKFRLSDSKVVEPSSSYAETETSSPSPEVGARELVFEERIEDVDGSPHAQVDQTEPDRGANSGSPNLLGGKENRRGRGGRFLSPIPSPLPSPRPSPIINGSSLALASSEESGFSGGLLGADDGGSGVGFFELDEELASPGLREKPMELEMEAALEDAEVSGKRRPKTTEVSFAAGSVPIDIVRPNGMITGSWVGSFGH